MDDRELCHHRRPAGRPLDRFGLGGRQSLMAQAPQVAVVGLRALNRDLGRIVADRGPLNKAMAAAGRAAAEPVAAMARSALPHASGRLAGDVRVTASRSGAAVRMGRKTLPYAGWVEFGGTRRKPHDSARLFVRAGRYLFPAAAQLAPVAARLYSDATTAAFANYRWTNRGDNPGGVHD
jgi:hypothetical protein